MYINNTGCGHLQSRGIFFPLFRRNPFEGMQKIVFENVTYFLLPVITWAGMKENNLS
jgi:hypothetical protein